MTTFTKDDIGKAVETADGEELGVVTAVDRETAYVEPDPGIADSVRATLGWGGASDDVVPIADDAVREITDDAIRLAETVPEDAVAAEDEGPDEGSEGSGRRDVEYSRGEPVDPLGSETGARRDLEVDPTEATDRDPEVEVRPVEDVDDRTDARVESDDLREEGGGPTTEDDDALGDGERSEREDRNDEDRNDEDRNDEDRNDEDRR